MVTADCRPVSMVILDGWQLTGGSWAWGLSGMGVICCDEHVFLYIGLMTTGPRGSLNG